MLPIPTASFHSGSRDTTPVLSAPPQGGPSVRSGGGTSLTSSPWSPCPPRPLVLLPGDPWLCLHFPLSGLVPSMKVCVFPRGCSAAWRSCTLASSLHLSWDVSASPQLPPLHLLLSDSLSSGPLTRFPPWVDEKSLALSSFAGKIKISITDVRIFKEQQ